MFYLESWHVIGFRYYSLPWFVSFSFQSFSYICVSLHPPWFLSESWVPKSFIYYFSPLLYLLGLLMKQLQIKTNNLKQNPPLLPVNNWLVFFLSLGEFKFIGSAVQLAWPEISGSWNCVSLILTVMEGNYKEYAINGLVNEQSS